MSPRLVMSYRALFEAHPDAMLLVGDDGQIVLANPAAEELFGYDQDALAGLHVDALVPDAVRSRHAALRGGYMADPKPRPMGVQTELRARRSDGSEVQVEIALSPVTVEGRRRTVVSVRSIAAYPRILQAQRRARFAEAVARAGRMAADLARPEEFYDCIPGVLAEALQVPSALLHMLDVEGRHFHLQAGVGLAPGEVIGAEVLNRPDVVPGLVLARSEPVVQELPTIDGPAASVDVAGSAAPRTLAVPLMDTARPVGVLTVRAPAPTRFGADELHFVEALGSLVVSRWQRARDEAALQHSQRLDAIGRLTGGVAHDFNNLLTVVQGNLQVLEDHPALREDAAASAALAAALRAARRGGELTGKLLAIARRQRLSPAWVDAGALVHSLGEMLRRTLDAQLQIVVDVAGPCPACEVDAVQLESALLNLAINARDAMPDGGTLHLRARDAGVLPPDVATELAEWQAPAHVLIEVADTGSGMAPDVLERAFEPFFTTKEKGRGTGLGLSTVYGFVKQSRGAMRCVSTPGVGTTLSLYLPAEPDLDDFAADDDADDALPAVGAVALPPGLRVLLVEDEADVRWSVRGMLAALGADIATCPTAEEAIEQLEREAYDFLLSDISLGVGMRGTELADLARRRWPGMGVLLMSGYASGTDELALSGFLRKPFGRGELAAAVANALGR